MEIIKDENNVSRKERVLEAIGTSLHILQYLYSHTDWNEGEKLIPFYKKEQFMDLAKASEAANSSRGGTLDLDAIYNGNKADVDGLIYFIGGFELQGNVRDAHNLFGADGSGAARDKFIAGSYDRDVRAAEASTAEFLHWAHDNMKKQMRCELFADEHDCC